MADVSVAVRAKRKRGRPRKDSNLCNAATLQSPDSSSLMKPQGAELLYPTPAAVDAANKAQEAEKNCIDDGVVGSMVYGVVEGSFDAGYLISVRIGNNLTPFRGVVFQPRKVVAVTAANDLAPQAKMYQRREMPVPVYDNLSQSSGFGHPGGVGSLQPPKQAVVRPHLPPTYTTSNQSSFMAADEAAAAMMRTAGGSPCKQYSYVHPTGSLRMVEEDEVMQAFEVSTSSGGSKSNLANNGDMKVNASTNQEAQGHGKAVESPHTKQQPPSASNLQMCHSAMAAPPSAFEIHQQEEMICRETMDQLQGINAAAQNRAEAQSMKAQVRPCNLFQDVNFHENLFSVQSREQESMAAAAAQSSPNLKLDLAFAVDKEKQMAGKAAAAAAQGGGMYTTMMKNPNIGFHQALVAGNPLLLPPDLMGEPLEFMMDKPKSPPNSQEANMEVQSRLVGSGERFHGGDEHAMNGDQAAAASPSAYKLELATPQSGMNTRIADMDFVLSNAMQPAAQSHTNNHG